jgi:hypothetical protein
MLPNQKKKKKKRKCQCQVPIQRTRDEMLYMGIERTEGKVVKKYEGMSKTLSRASMKDVS